MQDPGIWESFGPALVHYTVHSMLNYSWGAKLGKGLPALVLIGCSGFPIPGRRRAELQHERMREGRSDSSIEAVMEEEKI